jgi:hypothetical protein
LHKAANVMAKFRASGEFTDEFRKRLDNGDPVAIEKIARLHAAVIKACDDLVAAGLRKGFREQRVSWVFIDLEAERLFVDGQMSLLLPPK